MSDKMITVISNTNFVLFKGLSQKDLSGKNPADHNRLNIRPMWAQRMDAEGKVQRIDFVMGDNEVPEYVTGWDSFKKMCDNGTLGIKGSYSANSGVTTGVDLAKLKALEEANKNKEAELEAMRKELEAVKKAQADKGDGPNVKQL